MKADAGEINTGDFPTSEFNEMLMERSIYQEKRITGAGADSHSAPADMLTAKESPVKSNSPSPFRAPGSLDAFGAAASFLCAMHCALMPLVITLLPLVGLQFLAEGWVEWVLIGTAAVIGITSLCLGFREHRSRRALAVLAAGISLVVLGRVSEQYEWGEWGVPVLVLGGITIAGSHLLNRKLCNDCRSCSVPHK
ncbi:MAG: hypothetical protein OHK0029_14550 [Armatimonadaceae bacterium]